MYLKTNLLSNVFIASTDYQHSRLIQDSAHYFAEVQANEFGSGLLARSCRLVYLKKKTNLLSNVFMANAD